MDATTSENAPTAADAGLPDGGGSKYLTPVIILTHTDVCFVYNTYMLRYTIVIETHLLMCVCARVFFIFI